MQCGSPKRAIIPVSMLDPTFDPTETNQHNGKHTYHTSWATVPMRSDAETGGGGREIHTGS